MNEIKLNDYFSKVEVVNGYLNFYLNKKPNFTIP